MRIATASVVLFSLFFGIVHAEETAGIPDNIIKELDLLVGTWESKGVADGKEQIGGFTCRWARGEGRKKCCLIGHFSYTTEGEVRSGVTLIGWNAAKECIEDRGFDALGGNATLLWTIESPTLWRGDITVVEDGKTVKAKADLVKKGSTELVYEAKFEDGKVSRIVFRKVKDAPKRKGKKQ